MAKYKVYFSGFAYIEADSIEEAEDNYDFYAAYEERMVDMIEEVDEFPVDL